MTAGRTLALNVVYLGVAQAVNYAVPLLTLPYLARVLGVDGWGNVAFAQAIISYFLLVANWGFSTSATRLIAANRANSAEVSRIFMATWSAQWLLTAVCVAVLAAGSGIPVFHGQATLFLYGIGLIISGTAFPAWFFAGLEQLGRIAVVQMLSRLCALPLLFLFVHRQSDAPLVIAIYAISALACSLLGLAWSLPGIGLSWSIPSRRDVLTEFLGGTSIFFSTLSISFYTMLTPIVLGAIHGTTAVAYYALADRVKLAAQGAISPIAQALFPRMSHLFANDERAALRLVKVSAIAVLALAGALSVGLWFGAGLWTHLLGGPEYAPSIEVLQWLAPTPFVIAASNMLAVQVMLPRRHHRAFSVVLAAGGGLSLVLMVPLIRWAGPAGAAQNVLLVETFVCMGFASYVHRRRLLAETNTAFSLGASIPGRAPDDVAMPR